MKKHIFLFFILALFNCHGQNWTWMHGPNTINTYGFYGTLGISSPTNVPGSRHGSCTWTDAAGNLWLFGGEGLAVAGVSGWLNDLWKYNKSTNEWTWIKGANVKDMPGVYGTLGIASTTNNPGAREFSVHWTDASGNFWLFGGYGFASTGPIGYLNDLWKYNPTTNEWTWIKGSNASNINGGYGTISLPSSTNTPGGRESAMGWSDSSGNLWLFGGHGYDASSTSVSELNDLWKFNISTGQWTWMSGSNFGGQYGVYGVQGIPNSANIPGGRDFSAAWYDAGNLWMFGGNGWSESGVIGYLNDLWKYNISTGQWTWMKGSKTINKYGVYGNQLVSSLSNSPGARYSPLAFKSGSGELWLFGGLGYAESGSIGRMEDFFKYNPVSNEWTWMKGSKLTNQYANYGTKGITVPSNAPGARDYSNGWVDNNGEFWMFGGFSFPVTGSPGNTNDLWKFNTGCIPTNVTPAANLKICSGNNTTLSMSSPGGIKWFSSPTSTTSISNFSVFTTPTLTAVSGTSVYTYYAESTTCTVTPTRIGVSITVNALPTVTIAPITTSICSGYFSCLNSGGASSYMWAGPCGISSNQQNPCFPFYNICGCTYTVFGTDTNGCVNTATICTPVIPSPVINSITSNSLICVGQTATISSTGAITYTLIPGGLTGTNIVISPTVTSNYTITGTGANGCNGNAYLTQNVSACTGIHEVNNLNDVVFYPNPTNGDLNIISNTPIEISIYNCIGEKIMDYKNLNTIHLNTLRQGVYYIEIRNNDGAVLKKDKLIKL